MTAAGARPRLLVVGASHRSSAAATRDRLFVAEQDQPAVLDRLRRAGLGQALLLSTCARTEVQAVDASPARAAATVTALFAELAGTSAEALAPELYSMADAEAVRHIFRVAAALDSPVIGEPQVTGQVRDSHGLARAVGMIGRELESVLSAAYAAARRVRNETTLGHGPVSIAAAARRLARDVHGDLARCSGLMLIGGDIGELVAEHILASGLRDMVATARIPARSEAVARRHGCHHAPIERLPALLAAADIVVSSLGTGSHAITAAALRQALRERRNKPILVIDAAIPGDVEPAVDRLDGAFLYDLADLERIAEAGLAGRALAASAAGDIVEAEVASYLQSVAAREATPAIVGLREHFETVRDQVLAERGSDDAAAATRRLVSRLLDAPSRALARLAAEDADGVRRIEALLGELFAIDPARRPPDEDD